MDSIIDSIRKAFVPVRHEGYPYIVIAGIVAIALGLLWSSLFWIGAIITAWMAYLFRDPPRVSPQDANLVLSPADGVVAATSPAVPPAELGLGTDPLPRVSVFMSIFDCHVNRAPVAGRVARVAYKPGKFVNADLDKAREDNERNCVVIESSMAASALSRSPNGGAPDLVLDQRGRGNSRRPAIRHDSLRFAARRLSASGCGDNRQSGADGNRGRNHDSWFGGVAGWPVRG